MSLVVPILLYHYVGNRPKEDETDLYRADLWVTVEDFEQQLQCLQASGYTSVGLNEVVEFFHGRGTLPVRPVVLTFDDGQEDNYTAAFPLLCRYGVRGTFFVVSESMGKPGYMSWEQLSEMAARGMEIESHGATHADLTVLSPVELRRELEAPRDMIKRRLGLPARYLAYPGGHFNSRVVAAAGSAGYEAAVTTLPGITVRPNAVFEMPRVRVHGTDSVAKMAERMSSDETRKYAFKRVMRRMGVWRSWKKLRKAVRKSLGLHRHS